MPYWLMQGLRGELLVLVAFVLLRPLFRGR